MKLKKIISFLIVTNFLIVNTNELLKYNKKKYFIKAATNNSRFGDCLSIIFNSIYLAYKYEIPLICENFIYSDELKIKNFIKESQNYIKKQTIKKIIKLSHEHQIKNDNFTLYEIDINTKIDLTNNEILKKTTDLFRKFISLINKNISFIKKDFINVAVHVRKGGGYDLPLLSVDGLDGNNEIPDNCENIANIINKYTKEKFKFSDLRWPFKFPPDSFYVEQIKKISEIFKDKPIHIRIFTDDKNPKLLVEKYKKAINKKNIIFSYREKLNCHDRNVVEDFFAMAEFECLIRPVSYFSQNIERIANFKIIIMPSSAIWIAKNRLYIDKVNIIMQ